MSITKSIGKNTLGGGNSIQVDLKTYNRSTHNLSAAWRSSMGVGTLVPCLKLIGLPGDTFDIDIDTKVMTHPTVGPLFGSYKMQIDIFTAPFRLYNAMLHNNALNIGLDMSKVKLPAYNQTMNNKGTIEDSTRLTYSSSSILTYLGQRTIRNWAIKNTEIKGQAVPWLAYLDIFKNFYANKQENNFYYLVKSAYVNTTFTNRAIDYDQSGKLTTGGTIEIVNMTLEQWNASGEVYGTKTEGGLNTWLNSIEINKYWTPSQKGSNVLLTFKRGQYWRFGEQARYRNNSYIQSAGLTSLDELREKILSAGSEQFTINRETNKYFQDVLGESNGKWNLKEAGCGLILKTYQSDMFTNWVKTEWITGENGISAVTAISTVGDKFTIDQLNLSKKVYDMLNRIAVSGGTYQDWVETVYTSDWNMHTETPMYEGGLSTEIEFQEVVSNSASGDEPLGTLAGRGINTQKKGGKLHIKIQEPCYIIGIASITPRVDYCQGNDFDINLETLNDLHKPALDGIGYQDLMTSQAAGWVEINKSYGKTVAWLNYMTNYNKTYGTFAENGNEAFMVLNRIFEPKNNDFKSNEIDNTSYIDPSKYNYIFAETTTEAQNFWVQIGFGIESRRVMSAKQIPNL
nr:MAG TPA: Major capsid protein [Microviridae sp.]